MPAESRDVATAPDPPEYRRDRVTWAAFGTLFAFGVLNAGLGPALPYLRDAEHLSYLGGALHQVAYAIGGGFAGLVTARVSRLPSRAWMIRGGLLGAGLAWLAVGYGNILVISAAAAFLVSALATAALVRLWAVLADAHGTRRTVAMTEGEVAVSLGGIVMPLLIATAAGTALGWRMSFVLAAALVAAIVLSSAAVPLPAPASRAGIRTDPNRSSHRVPLTLVIVFAIVALEFSLTFWLASYLVDGVGLDRRVAVGMVSGLYVANLVGRVLASQLARRISTEVLLAGAIAVALLGLPVLLAARGAVVAGVGLAVVGAGVAGTFPLTTSLHVAASDRSADAAVGEVLAAASVGQICGPVIVAALAEIFDLRIGLLSLIAFATLAAVCVAGVGRARSGQTHTNFKKS
jgi:fucose permease